MAFEVMKDMQGYLEKDMLRKFLYSISSPRDKALFNLLARTGRRVGEILMLKVEDIDYFERTIVWCIEKKKPLKRVEGEIEQEFKDRQQAEYKRRKIEPVYRARKPIDQVSLSLLEDWIESENLGMEDKVFNITRFRVYQLTRKYGIKAGFPTIRVKTKKGNMITIPLVGKKSLHPHHFRHTFAVTKAKEMTSPAELEKLRNWLEHSNIGTTQQYLKFRMEEMRDMTIEGEI